ncbi:MAG: glycosyltransferase family 4 protein [Actinomycetota bacterium]|nr:glycosyltransferase family 4 protein [Actinomycetota bacterium]
MSKIVLFGMSPLPFENDKKAYGTGIRTWQFLMPLLKNNHDVCLISYAIPSAYNEGFKTVLNRSNLYEGMQFLNHILSPKDFEDIDLISGLVVDFSPDVIAGATFYPSYAASETIQLLKGKMDIPFWADLFGHVMAEGQARAFIDDSDECLFHYWNKEYSIIRNADIFSCVSGRQAYATVGELGAAGRLNRKTSGYEFTRVIPIGIPDEDYVHEKQVFRGKGNIAEDDFVVLWTGGFNTWTDVDTLFEGLTMAMKSNPKIKFVSTGGEIPEQDMITYPHFVELVNQSSFKENFLLMGWIKGNDVPNYYFEADIGINIDKDIYEVKLGSKSRILDWMRAGLPVISSNVCELTEIMQREKIGYTFKPHDAAGLSGKLVELSGKREELLMTARKAREYANDNFSFSGTVKPFINWIFHPSFAPDRNTEKMIFFEKEEALNNCNKIIKNQINMIKEKDARIKELENIASKNPLRKIYGYLKVLNRKMRKNN